MTSAEAFVLVADALVEAGEQHDDEQREGRRHEARDDGVARGLRGAPLLRRRGLLAICTPPVSTALSALSRAIWSLSARVESAAPADRGRRRVRA